LNLPVVSIVAADYQAHPTVPRSGGNALNFVRIISVGLALITVVFGPGFFGPCHAIAAGANNPSGIWLTEAGDAKIRVSRCGGGICGTVVWLREPIDPATGKIQVDDKNEKPAQRNRRIVGLSLFIGMKTVAPKKWSGRIYNADDGKTYDSNVTLQEPGKLKVQGCVGVLCGSETWSRSTLP
jgi:uncharacterized protein (DUF2147 family)